MRQVFLFVLIHGRGRSFPSKAANSCTCRENSRTMYEPGVHTGIIRLTCDLASVRCTFISTSNKCVHGLGIDTVKEMSVCFGACASAPELQTRTSSQSRATTRHL